MKFTIAPEVFEKHPDLAIGVIVAKGLDNTRSAPEITEMLRSEEKGVCNKMDADTFKEHPALAALQEVHRGFGSNPNKFPPSIQALIKRVLKGGQLPTISPLVDLYNVISLRHVICAGAEDTDSCDGDVRLAYADGDEAFLPLGGEENDPPAEGELVYKDDLGVICRKLNWREGDRSKITDSTKNAIIILEGFPPMALSELLIALNELSELIQQYCGGALGVQVLTKESAECEI